MARNKAVSPAELPEEQQPAFLDALAALPADSAALEQVAAEARELFNDAIRADAPAQVDAARVKFRAVVYRLNGDKWWGCRAPDGAEVRLEKLQAAPPGSVPGWGQVGEWLVEVEGMRILARVEPYGLGLHSFCLSAVDVDAPFLKETGHLKDYLDPRLWIGHELPHAARLRIEALMKDSCKPRPIESGYRENGVKVPAWLSRALSGVTRNGQLAMPLNGEALPVPEPEKKAPLSNAERQRLFRKRRKEKAEAAKAGDFAALEVTDASLLRVWEGLPSDFDRAATALALLRQRNDQHFELARAVLTLQRRLKDAGLEEQAQDIKWHWNPTPLGDYRATSAPEYMERLSAGLSPADERDQLARELEHLRGERKQFNAQLAECRRFSYDREQALKRKLDEAEAWGEHYRRQRDGKQAEVENLLGVVSELKALAEELSGPAPKVEPRPAPELQPQLAGVLDLAQLDESELELLKSALIEHHDKNKAVLWKDVACESLWKRLTMLQVNKVEWRADPFAAWGEDDPAWSKSALQTAAAEARQLMAEGLAKPGS